MPNIETDALTNHSSTICTIYYCFNWIPRTVHRWSIFEMYSTIHQISTSSSSLTFHYSPILVFIWQSPKKRRVLLSVARETWLTMFIQFILGRAFLPAFMPPSFVSLFFSTTIHVSSFCLAFSEHGQLMPVASMFENEVALGSYLNA